MRYNEAACLQTVNRSDARYWSEAEHYRGLTPLAVVECLRRTPEDRWPGTYDGLRQLGIGAWVVEWLELTFGARDGVGIPEQEVVAAFMHVMSQPEIRESLLKSHGLRESLMLASTRIKTLLKGKAKADHFAGDDRLVTDLAGALRDMTADAWPEQVFALST
jgi:Ca-activated chloride channel homolog